MSISNIEPGATSETFGQNASFKLEQPIGSMSISPSGRDVVLASKEGLHIIDLDSPYSPPRYLPHRTPWEVADVQWSPFAAKDYWIVSTSNQKALVWNVGNHGWRDSIEFVLHGHTRAITDINFSAFDPNILATCAVDSFVHAWDLRTPSRPAFSFSDWFAGATQVKWSRQDEHVVASSHDRFLHIWDKRKGAYPARTLEAHGTKIYGMDWNRFEPAKIVTCSLDKTIKFWNTNDSKDIPERVIETPFPVWRARHTPFGWGLLAMPQRGSNELHLYDRRSVDGVLPSGHVRPVATFEGHTGPVKEFLWRARGTVNDGIDHRDFQLVTWGSDRELRLHRIDEDTFNAIGYEKGVSKPQRLHFTRRNARYRTFRDGIGEPASPSELQTRIDSLPSQNQFLSTRIRPSTNVAMSKVAVAQFRGWVNGGRREKRTGMHGRGSTRQDMDPIAWMKNVKIASWDLDSLAEEIKQVGEKFKKVEFETVDVGQRKAVMSLQGPWGENSKIIYLRVELRFPQTYPRQAQAVINIQKTNAIDAILHRLLCTEINTIAETYKSRQRGCIEAVVRYLLKEQSMDQIVSWVLDESITDSKPVNAGDIPEDLSSDSDDDNLAGAPDASNSSANIRMPLPKACGAMWSHDGRLVCFFPQKSKEPASLLVRVGDSGLGDSQSKRTFEAFGRLHVESPARKPANGTHVTYDDTASDTSDTSTFSSSSSSSSTSDIAPVIRDGFELYDGNVAVDLRHRSRSGDRSNRSTTMDGTKVGEEVQLNFISIHHDTRELLPAKKILASEYKIMGSRRDACEHNAKIADDNMLPDVASVWRLAGLLLQQDVPMDIKGLSGQQQVDISFMPRRSTEVLSKKDGAVVFASAGTDTHCRIDNGSRWGNSPLAAGYLITAIFNYFEKVADIQMLALLACVFSFTEHNLMEFPSRRVLTKSASAMPTPRAYSPSTDTAFTMTNPIYQGHQHSNTSSTVTLTTDAMEQHLSIPSSNLRHQRRLTTQLDISNIEKTDLQLASRESLGPDEVSRGNVSNQTGKPSSTSVLPMDLRTLHRPSSGTAFAASRASLNALAQSFSNSPPSNGSTAASSFKKLSPSTSLVSGNWSGPTIYREASGRTPRVSVQADESRTEEVHGSHIRSSVSSVSLYDMRKNSQKSNAKRGSIGPKAPTEKEKPKSVKHRKRTTRTVLYNQDRFDIDGHAKQPLLDPSQHDKYRAYRLCYADLLGAWGLWLQRAELLYFDQLNTSRQPRDGRRSSVKVRPANDSQGLDVVRCCHDCNKPLAPIQKNGIAVGWHCTTVNCLLSPSKISKQQVCSICHTVMRGLTVPCLQCGHVTCYDCAQVWFDTNSHTDQQSDIAASGEQSNEHNRTASVTAAQPCPTGCGCFCATLEKIDVPYPPSEESHEAESVKDMPVIARSESGISEQSANYRSSFAPDTAFGAMMALSYRSRAASSATKSVAESASINDQADAQQQMDELVPWPSSRFSSLGRGLGAGLSRGLSTRSSDATVRKV